MRRILFSLSIVLISLSCAYAFSPRPRNSPAGFDGRPLASSDYSGVDVATSNFSASFSTVATEPCWVYGVTFSSGDTSGFVQIFATGTYSRADVSAATETIRLFNINGSTVGVGQTGTAAGYVPIGARPVRFNNGCGFKPSVAGFNSIILHHWREEE